MVSIHLENAHVHHVERKLYLFRREEQKTQQESQGTWKPKWENRGLFPLQFWGFFPHLLADVGAKAELTSEEFYVDLHGGVFDFSPPALLPFCPMFLLFSSSYQPHATPKALPNTWKNMLSSFLAVTGDHNNQPLLFIMSYSFIWLTSESGTLPIKVGSKVTQKIEFRLKAFISSWQAKR